jgi:hypothetical protein
MFGKWKFYRQHCERQKSPSPLGKGLLYFLQEAVMLIYLRKQLISILSSKLCFCE